MKRLLRWVFPLAFSGLLFGSAVQAAEIEGIYKVHAPMVAPKAHSLDKVVIHEVFYFGCPHCYHLHQEWPKFLKHFGNKVEVVSVPIGWSGPDPGRLMMIARLIGPEKEEAIKSMIFDFVHAKGLGRSLFTRDKLQFVAKLNGLSAEFNTQMDDPKVVKMMNDAMAYAKKMGVESTPTLILGDSLIVEGADLNNLTQVVNSLLKQPVP